MTASPNEGLVLYAVVAVLVFVGLLVVWPALGPTAAAIWFVLLVAAGLAIRFFHRGR
jgi:hypothetical protein